ncbi:hypothetical protein [Paenibacillus sp. Soil787]|uniref:hypothetical protein n=1 Tax=Paenibacillus sp. Soil787 TaxID=1736411 RepID=UPI000A544E5F|nr:hypothetical protein [Paenibacillus sp. Soil787]
MQSAFHVHTKQADDAQKKAKSEQNKAKRLPLSVQGLIKNFTPVTLQSVDSMLIDIFEWLSEEAKDKAYTSPKVLPI